MIGRIYFEFIWLHFCSGLMGFIVVYYTYALSNKDKTILNIILFFSCQFL